MSIQLQDQLNGSPVGKPFVIGASNDAFRFLQIEKDEQQGGKVVREVIKHFSPGESLYFIGQMRHILEMVKRTRLAHLTGESLTELNTFFGLDKDYVISLRGDYTTFSHTI